MLQIFATSCMIYVCHVFVSKNRLITRKLEHKVSQVRIQEIIDKTSSKIRKSFIILMNQCSKNSKLTLLRTWFEPESSQVYNIPQVKHSLGVYNRIHFICMFIICMFIICLFVCLLYVC